LPLPTAQLAETDRNGKLAGKVAAARQLGDRRGNKLTRPLMEKIAGIDRDAALPKFHGRTFAMRAKRAPRGRRGAPAAGRKAVLYATCFVNYNNPGIGEAAQAVLAKNGVETEIVYPGCCGMPQLEQGDPAAVAAAAKGRRDARTVDRQRLRRHRAGAVLRADAEIRMAADPAQRRGDRKLATATFDISEYIVDIAKGKGWRLASHHSTAA
jgi:glycerol-3-phosphate dehydrogenase subunit C